MEDGNNWLVCEDARVELVCNPTYLTTRSLLNNSIRMWKPLTRQLVFLVTLKRLGSAPVNINEIKLCRLFSSASHNSNPVNHCIPVYEVLEMPEKGVNFLVMPFLSFWERPPSPFEPVGEAVDCIGQMFKVRPVDYIAVSFLIYNYY